MIRGARPAASVILLALVAAACGGGDDGDVIEAPTTTQPPSTTEPTTTTERAATTTTSRPLPDPVTRSRLVVTGPEEVVFDWTTDNCEPEHIPDIAARAYRDADGNVHLTIGHYVTYRMIGPTLDDVASDCTTVQLRSDYDPDPAQFNDSEWIGSPFTLDGETVYAVVHNEYRGDTHRGARPGQCPSGQRLPCLDTSFTMAISTDGGDTFGDIVEPPGHLIASLPYTYRDDTIPTGIRQPSNVIEGPDGYFYLFGNVSDHPDERQWVCAMRTDDLSDPASWRYWNGTEFVGVWRNPYTSEVTADEKCAPLADATLAGSVQEGVVYDERLQRYVMVGVSSIPSAVEPRWGVYYSTSENLIEWSMRQLLLELPVNATVADPDTDTTHAYPSLIDPDSSSLNFSTSDGELFLYMSRFNFGGGSLDRDLLRWPVSVVDEVVEADWSFDSDGEAEGWFAAWDLTELVVVDGAATTSSTGDDPYLEIHDTIVPATYDRVVIRMRLPEFVNETAQLFWGTDESPGFSEAQSVLFPVTGNGDFEDYELDLSESSGWSGTITSLRIDPLTSAGRDIAIDRVWFPTSAG